MSEQQETFRFDGWAIFEAFGHRKRAGRVRTTEMGGSAFFVVETPGEGDAFVTEVYAASALYALTPVTEEVARLVARSVNPAPITPYELPREWRAAIARAEQEVRERSAAIEAGDGPERSGDGDGWDEVTF